MKTQKPTEWATLIGLNPIDTPLLAFPLAQITSPTDVITHPSTMVPSPINALLKMIT